MLAAVVSALCTFAAGAKGALAGSKNAPRAFLAPEPTAEPPAEPEARGDPVAGDGGVTLMPWNKLERSESVDESGELVYSSQLPGRGAPRDFPEALRKKYADGSMAGPEMVAEGGFGQTWKVFDMERNSFVVVKLFTDQLGQFLTQADDAGYRRVRAAQQECKVVQDMHTYAEEVGDPSAQHLMRCLEDHTKRTDNLDADAVLYIVLEHIDGVTLQDWLEQRWANDGLTPQLFTSVLKPLLDGLAFLTRHNRSWVHHDMSPRNVMVDASEPESPKVKIIDFGGAYEIGSQPVMDVASSGYAPPNVGREDASAYDAYASASIVVYMLTGQSWPRHAIFACEMYLMRCDSESAVDAEDDCETMQAREGRRDETQMYLYPPEAKFHMHDAMLRFLQSRRAFGQPENDDRLRSLSLPAFYARRNSQASMGLEETWAKMNAPTQNASSFPNQLRTIEGFFRSPDFVREVENALGAKPEARPSCGQLLEAMPAQLASIGPSQASSQAPESSMCSVGVQYSFWKEQDADAHAIETTNLFHLTLYV